MKISFGNQMIEGSKRNEGIVAFDLEKEHIHFILLLGRVGAGKTLFHRHIYHELIEGRRPHDIAFLFLDPAGAEALGWNHSPYLYAPVQETPEEGLKQLEALAQELARRHIRMPGSPALIIHIEEDAMVALDRERLERALASILEHKKTNGVYIFYSTSKVHPKLLREWKKRFIDLLVVFKLESAQEALFIAGDIRPLHFSVPGEHLIIHGAHKIHCTPFPAKTQVL